MLQSLQRGDEVVMKLVVGDEPLCVCRASKVSFIHGVEAAVTQASQVASQPFLLSHLNRFFFVVEERS